MNTSSGKNPNELNLLSLLHTLFSFAVIDTSVLRANKARKGMRKMHVALNKAGVLNVIQLEALGKSFFKDGNWL
jgi:hypothetical protein